MIRCRPCRNSSGISWNTAACLPACLPACPAGSGLITVSTRTSPGGHHLRDVPDLDPGLAELVPDEVRLPARSAMRFVLPARVGSSSTETVTVAPASIALMSFRAFLLVVPRLP